MTYTLPELPYAKNALEPHIDELTMTLHHDKHHNTYVTNLNAAIEKYPELGSKSIGSLSNCFVIGTPEDSYGGIFQKDEQMAQLMKRRGGVGLDISTLRPKDTLVSNAAKTTTGAISFMHRFSNTTNEVAQNGRRGK